MTSSHLDIGKRIILTPRSMQSILTDMITSGTDYDIFHEHVTGYMSPTFILRDVTDRLITEQGRKFNIAAGFLSFLANICYVSDKAYEFVLPEMTDVNRLDDKSIVLPVSSAKNHMQFISEINSRSKVELLSSLFKSENNKILYAEQFRGIFSQVDAQFSLIDGVLHVSANSDILDILREFPYEMFLLTMLQEWIANESKSVAGTFTFQSPLVYLSTIDKSMINRFSRIRWPFIMPYMPVFSDATKNAMQDIVTDFDWEIYVSYLKDSERSKLDFQYMLDMVSVIQAFRYRSENVVKSMEAYKNISDKTLKHVLRPWCFPGTDTTEDVETYIGDR